MAIQFETHVLKVEVKEKRLKHEGTRETPEWIEVIRVGKLTLEFDGDAVDVNTLAQFIGKGPSSLGLANTQHGLQGL